MGPLFFSGLIKSRTLSQLIKRLQETAAHHHNEAENYKKDEPQPSPPSSQVVKSESMSVDTELLPALSIQDLTGESIDGNDPDSDLSESEEDSNIEDKEKADRSEEDKRHDLNMACYHTAAERLVIFC